LKEVGRSDKLPGLTSEERGKRQNAWMTIPVETQFQKDCLEKQGDKKKNGQKSRRKQGGG